MTYTYALLDVSGPTYDEIAAKLRAAEYDHAFHEDGAIDMHGIALVRATQKENDMADVFDGGIMHLTYHDGKPDKAEDRPTVSEIEVTPEMIDWGVKFLEQCSIYIYLADPREFAEEFLRFTMSGFSRRNS